MRPQKHREKIPKSMHKYWNDDQPRLHLSKQRNSSGYRNVSICKEKKCIQGFYYRYSYQKHGKIIRIARVDFQKLEEEVKARGLPWGKLN